MKKIIVIAVLLVMSITGYAQNVDNFVVGPYEVDYKGEGDFKYRLRKGIDLYEFFGLKKDTVIQKVDNVLSDTQPVKNGFQLAVFMSVPRFTIKGSSNIFGLGGSWKHQLGKVVYFNAGVSLGYAYGLYDHYIDGKLYHRDDSMLEIGIPLSIEFTKLDKKKASIYAGIGAVPTFYSTLKAEELNTNGVMSDGEKDAGFAVAPRIDLGAHVPLNKNIFRIGVFGDYRINCSGEPDIYKQRVGRVFVGANIGIIF